MAKMQNNLYINFHDLVGFEIQSENLNVLDFYLKEYENHLIDRLNENIPLVSLRLAVRPVPRKARKNLVHNAHKILARWQYDIDISPEKIMLNAYSNRIGLFMIHHMMVHPSIRYLSAYQNTLMLHAGAVTKNGKSLLITGKGGAGKTTTTSLLLADSQDISPHADDYVFLNDANESLAYITRSHLYNDLLKWVPEISDRLTLNEKTKIQTLSLIRKFSSDSIKWPTRISQRRLWPDKKIDMKAKINAIILLGRDDVTHPKLIEVNQVSDYANELLQMNFSEAQHYIDLLSKQGSNILLNQYVGNWRKKEYELLIDRLRNIPHFRLLLPHKIQAPVEIKFNVNRILRELIS